MTPLNHACDIDVPGRGDIHPSHIPASGHLIVDRIEARGADSDQRFLGGVSKFHRYVNWMESLVYREEQLS